MSAEWPMARENQALEYKRVGIGRHGGASNRRVGRASSELVHRDAARPASIGPHLQSVPELRPSRSRDVSMPPLPSSPTPPAQQSRPCCPPPHAFLRSPSFLFTASQHAFPTGAPQTFCP
ncbi:hypothetical protein COCVIDRAFT_16100 [Bipolaris victoriae FI3]|uniref:Uncharacterized protein n=1 Tax=Bipolaris victoriae (strain FI3) TaxID=930091 RepID=W7ESR6_BIPV3|nr:hypothetical protein COCVIDRAFT_16100 [Bipolaris victoriae FI3]